jgi:hypothetical protein
MCCKHGSKAFYVLFTTVKTTLPVQTITKHDVAYKALEVFKVFPTTRQVVNTMKSNDEHDIDFVRIMKIDIPYSKLF